MKTEFSTLFLLVFVLFGRTNKQPVFQIKRPFLFMPPFLKKQIPRNTLIYMMIFLSRSKNFVQTLKFNLYIR